MRYTTPYDVFEQECGAFPDTQSEMPFSVWMSQRKTDYLAEFPEAAQNQIDGHFVTIELERFFRWISDRRKP